MIHQLNAHRKFRSLLVIIGVLTLLFTSCKDECEVENVYTYYEPVYTTLEEVRSSVELIAPKEINVMGKIYIKDNYLFVNEPNEGVHIIDNSDPSNPVSKYFLNIPGSFDISVMGCENS